MTLLALGTKVYLSPESEWYGDTTEDSDNPMNTIGEITEVNTWASHCYRVQWSNGEYNMYMKHELRSNNEI